MNTSLQSTCQRELCVFADASTSAISAIAYLRAIDTEGHVHVGFCMGKSKLAPRQVHTVPRLELCTVLAVEIADMLLYDLDTMTQAKLVIVQTVQGEALEKEIKTLNRREDIQKHSPLKYLNVFLDTEGLMRVGGRVTSAEITQEQSQPIVIPKKHHIAALWLSSTTNRLCTKVDTSQKEPSGLLDCGFLEEKGW